MTIGQVHTVEDEAQEDHHIKKINQIDKYLVDRSELLCFNKAKLEDSWEDDICLEGLHSNMNCEKK